MTFANLDWLRNFKFFMIQKSFKKVPRYWLLPTPISSATCRNSYATSAHGATVSHYLWKIFYEDLFFVSDTPSPSLPHPRRSWRESGDFFRIFVQQNPRDLRHFPRGFRQCSLHQAGFASVCVIGSQAYLFFGSFLFPFICYYLVIIVLMLAFLVLFFPASLVFSCSNRYRYGTWTVLVPYPRCG